MRRGVMLGVLSLLVLAGGAGAATPHFASYGKAHAPRWSPESGRNDRPLLVIYMEFRDVAYPAWPDVAALDRRVFGAFQSVADYWRAQSFGALTLSRARESDASGGGSVDDGIVRVRVSMTKAAFFSQPDPVQNKVTLEAADPAVNFALFDRNADGKVTDDELVTLRVEADTRPLPQGAAATRGVQATTLDGAALGGLRVAQVNTATNLISTIHETWHVLFGTRDFYGFGVGWLDVSAPTIGAADTRTASVAAWNKLALGWTDGTVVVRDGYHELREAGDVSRDSLVLYDPDRGGEDFFVVENRRRRAGTYDAGASDDGLVVWRVDQRVFASTDDLVRPVEIMRPDGATVHGCAGGGCYGGSDTDAFDPGDARTPQRTMERPWRDGRPSRVALRAIGRAGETMRVYVDVPGPGVLVDPYALDAAGPVALVAGEATSLTIAVTNTGEVADAFDVALVGLPAGWRATTATVSLDPGASAGVALSLTPSGAGGPLTLSVDARSRRDAAVASSAPLTVVAGAGEAPRPALSLKLRASARQRVLKRNFVLVRADCSTLCAVDARTTITVRRRGRVIRRFGGGRRYEGAGAMIHVPLSRTARRRISAALRARRTVEARVAVMATSDEGDRASKSVRVRITG